VSCNDANALKDVIDRAMDKGIKITGLPQVGGQGVMQQDQAFDGPEIPKTPIGDTKTVMVDGKERTVFNSEGRPIHPTVEGVRNFWRWFGDSKVVDEQGRPLVVYHGTSFSFDIFRIGKSGALFFAPSEETANLFGDIKATRGTIEVLFDADAEVSSYDFASIRRAFDLISKDASKYTESIADETSRMISSIEKGVRPSTMTKRDAGYSWDAQQLLAEVLKRQSAGRSIIPAYIQLKNPFDYKDPSSVQRLIDAMKSGGSFNEGFDRRHKSRTEHELKSDILKGSWTAIEETDAIKYIQELGFDGFVVRELTDNFAVFSPTQIKSATGNYGTFDPNKPSILLQKPDPTKVKNMADALRGMDITTAEEVTSRMKSFGLSDTITDAVLKEMGLPTMGEAQKKVNKATGVSDKRPTITLTERQFYAQKIRDIASGFKYGFDRAAFSEKAKGRREGMAEQKRADAKAERERIAERKKEQASFVERINEVLKPLDKKLLPSQVKAIVNRAAKVSTPAQARKFTDYVEKVFADAEYAEKEAMALKTAKRIKKKVNSDAAEKKVSAEQALAVQDFLGVDPTQVENIDQYLDIADRVLLTLEQVKSKGGEVTNESFAITNKDLSTYTTEQKQRQQDLADAELKQEYADLKTAGLVGDMTEAEYIALQDAINDEEFSLAAQAKAEEKLESMRRFVRWKQQFWNDQGAYEDHHTFSPQEQKAIDTIRNADVYKLDLPSLVKINTVMNNVMQNGDTSDLSRTAAIVEGIQNREAVVNLGLKDIKANLRASIENFAGNAERLVGAGAKKAAELRRLSGIDEVLDLGVQSQKRADKYAKDTLAKKKELGIEKDDTRTNRARMSMYNLTQQHYGGTQIERQQVFEEHKAMIEEDIKLLQEKKSLTTQEEHILDSITKAYDELLKGSNSAAEVSQKMADLYPQQKKLADWMVRRYDLDLRKKVFDSARLDNNMNPEEVANYAPRVWQGLRELPSERQISDIVMPERMIGRGVDKRPTGSKFSRTGRPKNSILSYDLIKNLQEGYAESDWDASTAHARNVLSEFFRGNALAKEIGSDAAQWMRQTVVDMLAEQRGLNDATDKDVREVMRAFNRARMIGRGIALKGVSQWVKQPTVIVNTWANLGRDATSTFSFIDMPNGDKLRDQFQIAGRRDTSAGYEKLVRRIHGGFAKEDMAKGSEAARHFLQDVGNKVLDKGEDLMSVFISTPDVWAANLSWNAFYKQSLKDQGIDIATRDFSREWQNPNKQAASYANQQVERLQGSNSAATMSRIYRNGGARVILSQAAPFSSFALNMRMRIIRDTNTLLYGAKEDKAEAAVSLAGTMAEQVAFQSARTAFYLYITAQLVSAALGALDLEDEEEKEKRKKREAERTPWRDAMLLALSDFIAGGATQFVQSGFQQSVNWIYRYLKPVETDKDGKVVATKDLYFQYPEREGEWRFVKYMGESGVALRTVNNVSNKIGEIADSDLRVTKGGANFEGLSMAEMARQSEAGATEGPRVEQLDKSLLTDKEMALALISVFIDMAGLAGFSEQNVNSINNAVWKEVKKDLSTRQGKETNIPVVSKPKGSAPSSTKQPEAQELLRQEMRSAKRD